MRLPRLGGVLMKSWIVAGAFFVSTALGRTEVQAAPPRITTTSAYVSPSAADQPVRQFAIPAGPMRSVIAAFELATGLKIEVASNAILEIDSPGVTGTFSEEAALTEMLSGTSLSFRFQAPRVVSIEFRAAGQSVDVEAPAVRVSTPKYTEPLVDIPQTINVVTADLMEQQGVSTLRDALRNV